MGAGLAAAGTGLILLRKALEKRKKQKIRHISLKNWTNDSIYVIIISGNPLS